MVIARLRRKYEELGFYGTVADAVRSLKEKIYFEKYVVIYVRSLEKPLPSYRPLKECEFRMMNLEDIDNTGFINEEKKEKYRGYLRDGVEGVISVSNGEILAYHFVCFEDTEESTTGIPFHLKSAQVYQFDGFVDPDFRGKGIFFFHMGYFFKKMLERGYEETTCLVDCPNRASIRFHNKIGFEPVKKARCRRFFGKWSYTFISSSHKS